MGKLLCRNGTIPCITLILGGNLTRGKTRLSPYSNTIPKWEKTTHSNKL